MKLRHQGLFQIAIFLSAFLLFLIEPMIVRAMLPKLGGSYAVWGISMFVFQTILLLGYLWGHFLQEKIGVVKYSKPHFLLLFFVFFAFPFRLENVSFLLQSHTLFLNTIFILIKVIGLPFFVLSTSSLVLQKWFVYSDLEESNNPYFLYSASNLGSITGLIAYPVIFEPYLPLKYQDYVWWCMYALLVLLYIFCVPSKKIAPAVPASETSDIHKPVPHISIKIKAVWFLASAAGCSMLLSVTNSLTFDVASMPFLWVLPLCIYLITFVLLFKRKVWFPEWLDNTFNWAIAVGILMYFLFIGRLVVPAFVSLPIMLFVLFVICMKCHKALVDNKPGPEHLTIYYLFMSIGGAVGSLLVSGLVPLCFNSVIEYPASLTFAGIVYYVSSKISKNNEKKENIITLLILSAGLIFSLTILPYFVQHLLKADNKITLAIILIIILLTIRGIKKKPSYLVLSLIIITIFSGISERILLDVKLIKTYRNFYGIYRVFDKDGIRYLQHGITYHGRQYLAKEKENIALLYYHSTTPAGEIFSKPPYRMQNIAMIGLGTGAMTSYLNSGQTMTIFEIDPDNLWIADDYFTYLKNAKDRGVSLRYEFGDGRISLTKYKDEFFDILLIDAFSSGAIPTHLLTVEAVKEYQRIVKSDGMILFHISNKYIDLNPVVNSIGKKLGATVLVKSNYADKRGEAEPSFWAVICSNKDLENILIKQYGWDVPFDNKRKPVKPWTDNYNNLFWMLLEFKKQ